MRRYKKYKYVCEECGSENIEFNIYGSATWDKEIQDYVIAYFEPSASEYEYCRDCESDVQIKEIEIKKKKLNKL